MNACNFTKSNNPQVFFTFFKFYKWYQIAQRITFFSSIIFLNINDADNTILPSLVILSISQMLRQGNVTPKFLVFLKRKRSSYITLKKNGYLKMKLCITGTAEKISNGHYTVCYTLLHNNLPHKSSQIPILKAGKTQKTFNCNLQNSGLLRRQNVPR